MNRDYFFSGQVFKPNKVYKGQKWNNPVAKGIIPINPHTFKSSGPTNAKINKARPITILATLSILPTFFFTKTPFRNFRTHSYET